MFLSFTAHVQTFHIPSRAANVFKTKHEKQNAPPFHTNISSDRRHFLLFDFRNTDTFLRINPMPCTHFRTIVKYLQRQALFGTQNKKQTMSLLLAGLSMRISLKNCTHNVCSAQ